MADSPIKIPPTIVVRDFAAKLGIPVTTVAVELIKNGIMSSMNEEIDFDTAAIIADDLGKKVELAGEEQPVETQSAQDFLKEDPTAKLVDRPPVVVVMGHVDHGKTSLLDTIRTTNVVGGEAGGITQHIGAYQVTKQNRLITFIDTPGHEAFTQMRARGAKIADVAIIVVAADDGIKPQTDEVLKIMADSKIPYLIALTKVDKPEANPEKVKKELAEKNILLEGWGGKIPVVHVSAKTKEGIEELLESILLVADLEQDALKVNPSRPAVGTIIESHVDPQQGPIASVLIQTGTLRIGEEVVVGQVWGKIRSLKNDRGELIKQAPPSTPVQILGLKAAPQVGDILRVAPDELKELKKKVKSHQLGHHLRTVVSRIPVVIRKKSDEDSDEAKPVIKKYFLIIKTDTLGSAEAILESLKKIQHQEVAVEVVQRGLGIISEADVLRAEAAKATVYGFHVPTSPKADELGRNKGVAIKSFKVIYDLIDDITAALEKLLVPLTEEKEIGRLKVMAVFRNENTFQVVGGKVIDGQVALGSFVDIMRGQNIVTHGTLTQLQSNKQNVKEVMSGNEAGLKIESEPIIRVGDIVVCKIHEIKQRHLSDQV